jgi:hypothetical protein
LAGFWNVWNLGEGWNRQFNRTVPSWFCLCSAMPFTIANVTNVTNA